MRIGTPEAEWHRYILANRCEYAFALYGAVVKFSLFTEIDTYWSVTWLTWLTNSLSLHNSGIAQLKTCQERSENASERQAIHPVRRCGHTVRYAEIHTLDERVVRPP